MPAPRTIVPALALLALVAFEAAVLWLIANPRVSDEYRAYFIERSTDCWPQEVSGEIELGSRVWFLKADARGGARELKVCGWLPAVGSGTWSVGPESRLALDAGETSGPLRLELDLFGYVRDDHPLQRVVLSANGLALGEIALIAGSERFHALDIPAAAIGADGRVELVFTFPDATSPQALGISDDGRRLAIRLVSLRLLPAEPATDSPPPA